MIWMKNRKTEIILDILIVICLLAGSGFLLYPTAGDVINALNTPVHKIQITHDRKQFMVAQMVTNGAWNRNFTVRRYLMPIPQGQIDSRAAGGIHDTQNPGW